MDFSISEEQQILADSVEKFAAAEVAPGVDAREVSGEFDRGLWKKLADQGLLGLCIPEEHGGGGCDALTTVIAMEAFARGGRDIAMGVIWPSHLLLAAMPISDLGSETLKHHYLPRMATGECIGALALTEPEAGSDATALRTTATRDGDHYVLNGSKTFISNAPMADVFVVFATVDLSKRAAGITIFVVDRNSPGLTVGKPMQKHGGHGSPTGELFFQDCRVPATNLMGEEGGGFAAMLTSLGWERLAFAPIIGGMEANLNDCIEYSRQRVQGGKPIARHQLVGAMLAEMKMDLDASRLLAYQLAWKKDQGEFIGLDGAVAKTFITEAFERNANKAVQIFGGNGCMLESPVGRSLWAAKMTTIGGGTSQVQRNIIGRLLTGL